LLSLALPFCSVIFPQLYSEIMIKSILQEHFRMKPILFPVIAAAALLLPISRLYAQEAATWTAYTDAKDIVPGAGFTVKLRASINAGWHVYSTAPMEEGPEPTEIAFPAEAPLRRSGAIRQPKPIIKFDENFGVNTEYYEKEAVFSIPARVKDNTPAGEIKTAVEVTFMACNDRMCLPSKTVKVPLTINVAGKPSEDAAAADSGTPDSATAAPSEAGAPEQGAADTERASGYGDSKDVDDAKREGLWAYIGLAMSMGALSLLTPCVFPMIPITVSFFTKRNQATKARSVRDALIYSLGIIFTFTVLGILLAVVFGASGINRFAANPWINMLIALIFIVFALNLFGLFEIVVPSGLLTKLTSASGSGQGIVSLLLMGLTFTLTSFTCTVPFIGTVMVAAASGEIWWSILGMLAFSAVFAFPFFLLAVFPSWLKAVPGSGGWLNSVKVVMGFLELAAAMKFISNGELVGGLGVLSRDLFLSFWVGIGGIIVLYLLGIFQLPHDTKPERIGVFRMIFGVFFFGITVFLFTGLNAKPLGELDAFLPPIEYQATIEAARGDVSPGTAPAASPKLPAAASHKPGEERWLADYEQALAVARAEKKPVFIDFTGLSCTNCRWMESNVFTRSDVAALLERYVLVRLFTDMKGEASEKNRRLQEGRFGTVALPLYVIMSPEDEVIDTFPGMTRKPFEFVAFLERGLKKSRSGA